MKILKQISTILLSAVFLPLSCVPAYVCDAADRNGTLITEDTISFYETWKEKYLVQDKYAADVPQYYVYYSEEKYEGGDVSVPVTVSEAHGL